jgi:hypothetical protein
MQRPSACVNVRARVTRRKEGVLAAIGCTAVDGALFIDPYSLITTLVRSRASSRWRGRGKVTSAAARVGVAAAPHPQEGELTGCATLRRERV